MHCSKTKGARFCQQMEEHVKADETLQVIRGRILWLLYYSFSKTGALRATRCTFIDVFLLIIDCFSSDEAQQTCMPTNHSFR